MALLYIAVITLANFYVISLIILYLKNNENSDAGLWKT